MPLLSFLFTEASTEAQREILLAEVRRIFGVTDVSRLIEGTDDSLISRMARVEVVEEARATLLARLRQNPLVEAASEPAPRLSA